MSTNPLSTGLATHHIPSSSSDETIRRSISIPLGLHRNIQSSSSSSSSSYSIYSSSFSGYPFLSSSTDDIRSRYAPRKQGLKTLITPKATSSMGNIEEQVNQHMIEMEVNQYKRQHSEELRQRRASFSKTLSDDDIKISPVLEKLPQIIQEITHSLHKLIPRAERTPDKCTHVRKKSIEDNSSGFGLTFEMENKKTFVHIPKSSFDSGGEAEIKLAIDITTQEIAVVSKKEMFVYSRPLHKSDALAGDRIIMNKCRGYKYLAVPYACTTRIGLVDGIRKQFSYSITKYYRGGNLSGKIFEGVMLLEVAKNIAKGLRKMHLEGLVHRDLKPQNMYFDEDHAVIGDFGTLDTIDNVNKSSLKTLKRFTRMESGTHAYKPPEANKSMHPIDPHHEGPINPNEFYELKVSKFEQNYPLEYVKKGDIFSLGVTLFELSRRPYEEGTKGDVRRKSICDAVTLFRRGPCPKKGFDKLLYRMLDGNPKNRPSCDEIVTTLNRLIARNQTI